MLQMISLLLLLLVLLTMAATGAAAPPGDPVAGQGNAFAPAQVHHLRLTVIHRVQQLPSNFNASGNRMKYDRFHQLYGVDPETVVKVMQDVQQLAPDQFRVAKPDEVHLLMTLEWIRTKKGMVELQGLYNNCPKTTHKYIWMYIRAIQSLKASKILFHRPDGGVELRTADCLHIPIREPHTNPSAKFCSPKMKRAALSYEVC
jgi:hypothetical protein